VAFVIAGVAGVASADTFYRWRDSAGRWHFSNRSERVPPGAQAFTVRPLSIVQFRAVPRDRSFATEPQVASGGSRTSTLRTSGCAAPDPSQLIEAIRARLDSTRANRGAAADLALFVGGVPVSYSSDSVVAVMGPHETGGIVASDQAAIAYPSGSACPRTPPLERYAVSAPDWPSSSGLCADYHRALVEIDGALARNTSVARPIVLAANYAAERNVDSPAWFVAASAAQTAELAAELEEFIDELTVAREEIVRASDANGCL